MTQDWSKMLKSFRTKTYRNLQEDQQQQRTYQSITSADNLLVTRESEPTKEKGSWSPEEILEDSASDSRTSSNNRSQYHFAIRGRSASEPSFLSVNRAVKVPPQRYSPTGASVSSSSNHNSTPPTVKEISSITGLQQQIKAAFGRWRKRGGQSSSTSTSPQYAGSEEEEALSESAKQQIREDSFDHPLNIRVSPSSQTFSHPHRLTVFPPFPGPPSPGQTPQTSGSNNNNNKSSGNPFAFVRGLRNKRRGDSNPASSDFASSSSCGGRTERTTADGGGWSSRSVQSDFGSSFPLVTKSRSDHSLHRILKDDHNAWTVFATLRSPHEKGDSLSKGSTAWTFGLFSNTDRPHQNCRRQASTASSSSTSSAVKSRCKAGSVAPSPELVHRTSFHSQSGTSVGGVTPAGNSLIPSFLGGRNERRTRSLERCFQHRVFNSSTVAAATIVPPARPPPVLPARIRSRSLEKNSHLSTTAAVPRSVAGLNNNNRLVGSSCNATPVTPLLPARRAQVTPEVLATWCTFNEAFGGSRPKHSPDPPPPLTVSDEKDSPGSPVFEELFLPPPNRYSGPITAAPVAAASTTSENKRNSSAGSCSPRSSPVPPSSQPETVLYGTREAPVLERHCVEGGEFIIAWLSHSNSSPSSSTTISHRAVPALPSEMQQPSSSSSSSPGNAIGSNTSANTPVGGSNRSFINKPARGWLHSDLVIVREGITYFVRYIGCLEVNTSMKSLDFDTRSQIAKECINLVCETAGLKAVDKKRKVDRRIQRILGDTPHMEHAGSDVALTISSGCLRISTLEGSTVVACHDMPNISFASGGDPDTLDFVAYVAKDNVHGRACYVLECGGGLAQDVITTIGQAFELRFKEYLKRTPRPSTETVTDSRESAGANGGSSHQHPPPWSPDDPEYYNDLPGKVPPDVGGPPPVPPLPNYQAPAGTVASGTAQPAGQTGKKVARHQVDLSDNLIDLNADVSSLAASRADGASGAATGTSVPPFADHEYVNGIVGSNGDFKTLSSTNKDPFDMHPFSTALPSPLLSPSVPGLGSSSSSSSGASSMAFSHKPITAAQQQRGGAMSKTLMNKTQSARAASHETQLSQEIWFHGPVSRKEAEDLLKHDGDFLVRESQGSHGQYVLTGMQSGNHKHLLLVDPEGVVRTKDRTFDSVSHLINYHRNNILPIISAESVLLLKRPVPRPHS